MARGCYGSGATIWVAPQEVPLCPHCRTEVDASTSHLGGGYRSIPHHDQPAAERIDADAPAGAQALVDNLRQGFG